MSNKNQIIIIFIKRLLNSIFSPKIFGGRLFRSFEIDINPSWIKLIFYKITARIWFFPSMYQSKFWLTAQADGNRGYKTFMQIDDQAQFFIKNLKSLIQVKDVPILDIGCNIGRFLNILSEYGCNNLTGIDINELAIKDSYGVYPALCDSAEMKRISIQQFLLDAEDESFEIVYTYGATIEFVHPTYPLIKNISRITKKYVCFYLSDNHSYVRLWELEFQWYGFELILKAPYSYHNRSGSGDNVLYIFKKKLKNSGTLK